MKNMENTEEKYRKCDIYVTVKIPNNFFLPADISIAFFSVYVMCVLSRAIFYNIGVP